MGTVSSSVGLISGIPIGTIVSQLVSLDAAPRNRLTTQNTNLTNQDTEIKKITAQLLSLQFSAQALGSTSAGGTAGSTLFNQNSITSSNPAVLTAASTTTATVAPGNYQYTPLQLAQAQQVLSAGFSSDSDTVGAGALTFRFGNSINNDTSLDILNGGAGFTRGKIRITDRSGTSTVIDLSSARTVNDVLNAINNNGVINVTAQADGDHIKLTDNTGQSASDLKVQDVNGGTTAASLGLANIDVAGPTANGADVVNLFNSLGLSQLNGGNGVQFDGSKPDLQVNFQDGTNLQVNFSAFNANGVPKTLGDVINYINTLAPGKLQAKIAPDGDRLQLTDLTSGGGTFSVTQLNNSQAASDLGLTTTASNGVITGGRLLAGLNTSLLSTLNGGKGLGTLGTIQLTDRNNATASVDLSSAETLQDVIDRVNAAGIGIQAQVNANQNGILLTDTTGKTDSNLIVANGDATNTADKLKLTVNGAVTSKDSGTLNQQVIGANTTLASLNGGAGVAAGSFSVIGVDGTGGTIQVDSNTKTIGDVINKLNALNASFHAQINDAGDGIELIDTHGGNGTIQVFKGSTSTAADLHLVGNSTAATINGVQRQVLNGSITQSITIGASDTLDDLVTKINGLNAGVTASIISDGSTVNPYHLQIVSNQSGVAGQLQFNTTGVNLGLQQTVQAQDARVLVAATNTGGGANQILSSSTNTFKDIVPGLSITAQAVSQTPVTVTVANDPSGASSTIQSLVTAYNSLWQTIQTDTSYNAQTNTSAILQGNPAILQLQSQLPQMFSGILFGTGSVNSLASLGVTTNTDGSLSFDPSAFTDKFNADPASIGKFFTTATSGFGDRLKTLVNQLAGSQTSLLVQQDLALQRQIQDNTDRITTLNALLASETLRLTNQFNNMELAISNIKNQQSVINSIGALNFFNTNNSSSSSSSSSNTSNNLSSAT